MTEHRHESSGRSFLKDYTATMVVIAEVPSEDGHTKQIRGECEVPRRAAQHQRSVAEQFGAQRVKSFVAPCQ